MDDSQDDMSNMRSRYEELRRREATGDLDDADRSELQQLKSHFFESDDM
jgi:hypothetical protein